MLRGRYQEELRDYIKKEFKEEYYDRIDHLEPVIRLANSVSEEDAMKYDVSIDDQVSRAFVSYRLHENLDIPKDFDFSINRELGSTYSRELKDYVASVCDASDKEAVKKEINRLSALAPEALVSDLRIINSTKARAYIGYRLERDLEIPLDFLVDPLAEVNVNVTRFKGIPDNLKVVVVYPKVDGNNNTVIKTLTVDTITDHTVFIQPGQHFIVKFMLDRNPIRFECSDGKSFHKAVYYRCQAMDSFDLNIRIWDAGDSILRSELVDCPEYVGACTFDEDPYRNLFVESNGDPETYSIWDTL